MDSIHVVLIKGHAQTVVRIIGKWDKETFDMLFAWAQLGATFKSDARVGLW